MDTILDPKRLSGNSVPHGLKRARALAGIGIMAFLTVVDLFATQALLPTLAAHYRVTPAAMGLAVNACTLGMAVGGIAVALVGPRVDPRSGIIISLIFLSIPTALLAFAPDLATFAALRIAQGVLMAAAFGLTLAHLGERFMGRDTANAFAAYITGNVASNLVGRLLAAAVVDHAGLAANFVVFAGLNLLGAGLAAATIAARRADTSEASEMSGGMPATMDAMRATWTEHLKDPSLRAAFGIGFAILFAFIGVFTYINFVLVRPPIAVSMMGLGFIYFVFLPSIVTTPLAGAIGRRLGHQHALRTGLAVALGGLPLLVSARLPLVLTGMTLVAAGTFFAQAVATGFVGRAARQARTAASGLYLASYFSGGLVGTAALGLLFDHFGWSACVAGVGVALACATLLSFRLVLPSDNE